MIFFFVIFVTVSAKTLMQAKQTDFNILNITFNTIWDSMLGFHLILWNVKIKKVS